MPMPVDSIGATDSMATVSWTSTALATSLVPPTRKSAADPVFSMTM